MNTDLMFSSATDQWATPQSFFDELDKEFQFNLDPCADNQNHKCKKYFTKEDDGLMQSWGGTGCFAILHTAKIFASGLKKHTPKGIKTIHLCAC